MRSVTDNGRPRLLIVARTLASLRAHYDDVIAALAEAGVDVTICYVNERGLSLEEYLEPLRRRGCEVRLVRFGRDNRDRGDRLALRLRQLANLLRFAHPDYRGREWLRDAKLEKAERSYPGPRRWARRLTRLNKGLALAVMRFATRVERLLPPWAAADDVIAAERPDAVAVVGVVFEPVFVDFLKAAAWQGIPTASWVQSWDNLTNKGLHLFTPDRVFVWNDFQKHELVRYHGIPERVACITGAQTFDHWFNGATPSSRDEFCTENGLDPERPIIVYLASSLQIEPPVADFFLRWLEAIRSSGDPVLEGATVLVRPHPTALEPWAGLPDRYPRVAVSPSRAGAVINGPDYRRRFRDELHHASVAVGLNTSGMIDAAILGKPVCTAELADIPNRQRGTLHFEYLVTVAGGFVRTAASLDEHVGILGELVRKDPYERDERSDRFVREFIRPHGLDVAPTKVFAKEMLRLFESPSEAPVPSDFGLAVGRLIHRHARLLGAPLEDGWVLTAKRRRRIAKRWRRIERPTARFLARLQKRARRPLKYWRGLRTKYWTPRRAIR